MADVNVTVTAPEPTPETQVVVTPPTPQVSPETQQQMQELRAEIQSLREQILQSQTSTELQELRTQLQELQTQLTAMQETELQETPETLVEAVTIVPPVNEHPVSEGDTGVTVPAENAPQEKTNKFTRVLKRIVYG